MIRFFDLLGIDRALSLPLQLAAAAAKWPSEEVQPFTGDAFGNTNDYLGLMDYLQDVLFFKAVYSGASGGTVGISAEMHIGAPTTTQPWPLVVAKMPDVAFFLQETHGVPAQISVTQNADDQLEVVIQGLPVEIRLPPGFVRPQRTPNDAAGGSLPDFTTTVAPFDAADPDSLQITLRDFDPSSIFVRVNVKMTPEFDFAIDTHMPISIGPCVFLGLPCEALHDLHFPRDRARSKGGAGRGSPQAHLHDATLTARPPCAAGAERDRADHRRHRVPGVHVATPDPAPLQARLAPGGGRY